jgi:hypothetical protein
MREISDSSLTKEIGGLTLYGGQIRQATTAHLQRWRWTVRLCSVIK